MLPAVAFLFLRRLQQHHSGPSRRLKSGRSGRIVYTRPFVRRQSNTEGLVPSFVLYFRWATCHASNIALLWPHCNPFCSYIWLDLWYSCGYINHMQRLSREQRVSVVRALCEGCSINSTVRMTGIAKTSILRLLADMGRVCMNHEDSTLRGLYWKPTNSVAMRQANTSEGSMVPGNQGIETYQYLSV